MSTDRRQIARNEEMEIEQSGETEFAVKGKYTVDLETESCTCPDHEYRNVTCKHIWAVKFDQDDIEENPTPPKPDMLDPKFVAIPDLLREQNHWVGWKQKLHQNKDGSKRWTKVPVDIENGGFASSTNPETWTDMTNALLAGRNDPELAGIGFVVDDSDSVIGVDFDDCRNPKTGEIDESVKMMVAALDSYTEISPSGTGLRTFVAGDRDFDWNQQELPGEAHLEVYDTGRYLTVTGHAISTEREIREIPSDELEEILVTE